MKFSKNNQGNVCLTVVMLSGLCILAFMSMGMLTAAAQDSDGQARTYCVRSGYLYSTSQGINGGQGICKFPDNSMWTETTAKICRNNGGSLRSVHTPYGDIAVCAFPDGRTCDLKSLAEGRCGGDSWLLYARSWLDAP
jgi:putative hemolysin